MWDTLWINGAIATASASDATSYGLIEHGAVAAQDGKIAWVGAANGLPGRADALARNIVDLGGALMTPGLVDCHTHLVYAGDRAREFEARLAGAHYEDIAKAGGGVMSTVRATRDASDDALLAASLARLDALIADGATTIEVKSGYGLDLKTELRILRTARRLAAERPVRIRTTLLAAHALPPEFRDDRRSYVDLICKEIIPAAASENLADAVDGFCEGIGFSPDEIRRVFDAAGEHGLPVKLHAEQLSDLGGAALAAQYGALSADHLEYLGADDVAALAEAGTVAVLLPGAFYFLRERQAPPVQALREAGVPIAVATDCNPGTSPLTSLTLAMNMAATLFGLTPAETLIGATRHAARALGDAGAYGEIAVDQSADFAIWDAQHPSELTYRIGGNQLKSRIFKGRKS